MTNECLGLPCSGKSFYLSHKVLNNDLNQRVIEKSITFNKIVNIFHALVNKPKFFLLVFFKLKMPAKTLILAERIGYNSRMRYKNYIVDEGVFQAVWAMFYMLDGNKEKNISLFNNIFYLLDCDLFENCTVHYISVNKKTHSKRVRNRVRVHNVNPENHILYANARVWMAILLRALRDSPCKIKLIKN